MFQRITREELANISPWPDRIDGKTQWKKARRTKSVSDEYEGRYADLERLWKSHVENNSTANRASLPLSFIYEWNRKEISDMKDRPDIYGPVDPDCSPVSFSDGLYAGDVMLMLTFHRQLVIRTVRRALGIRKVEGVVEIGCGCGPNLLSLALNFPGLSLSGWNYRDRRSHFSIGSRSNMTCRYDRGWPIFPTTVSPILPTVTNGRC